MRRVRIGQRTFWHCHRFRRPPVSGTRLANDGLVQHGLSMVHPETRDGLGLMTMGFGISMAVHPELSQWLIEWVGWREAWFWIGAATWILVLPPIVILAISKPEDVGLHPDGVIHSSTDEDGAESVGPQMDFTLSEALHAPAFYIVAASLITLSMLVTSLHFYQVSIFADQGLGPNIATKCFAVSSVTMIVMMPVVGRMLDQAPTERMVLRQASLF